MHKNSLLKILSYLLILVLSLEQAAWAAPQSGAPSPIGQQVIREVAVNGLKLKIPEEHVSLREVYRGSGDKLIIHIQDAHTNFSGQRNLARALDRFMKQHEMPLVITEGSSKDISLNHIREMESPKTWGIVAKRWLYDGIIAGEEYLNLTSSHPMKIIGLEEQRLYEENVLAYAGLKEHRKTAVPYLHRVRTALERIKAKRYPESVLRYERLKFKHRDAIKETHHDALLELAAASAVDLLAYPQVERYRTLKRYEKQLFPPSLRGSTKRSRSNPTEKRVFQDYQAELKELDFHAFLKEFEDLEARLYESLLTDEDIKNLRKIDRFVGLLEKAHHVQMSSAEYAAYLEREEGFKTSDWQAFLNRQLAELGYFDDLIAYEDILERSSGTVKDFYRIVDRRDEVFIARTEKILEDERVDTAFLIAGGYHTEHLTRLWRERGISYIVLTPVVTEETDYERYEELLLAGFEAQTAADSALPETAGRIGAISVQKGLNYFRRHPGRLAIAGSRLSDSTQDEIKKMALSGSEEGAESDDTDHAGQINIDWNFETSNISGADIGESFPKLLEEEKLFMKRVVDQIAQRQNISIQEGGEETRAAVRLRRRGLKFTNLVEIAGDRFIVKYVRSTGGVRTERLMNESKIINAVHAQGMVPGVAHIAFEGRARHPQFGDDYLVPFIVKNELLGVDFAEHLEQNGYGKTAQTVDFTLKLGRLIRDAIHGEGIVLRDLKPKNIIVMENGDPGLFDFDVSVSPDYDWNADPLLLSAETASHAFVEDYGWEMALKTAKNRRKPDFHSDVFAVAQLMAFALQGEPIAVEQDFEQLVNSDVEALLRRAMDRQNRDYQMTDFIADLEVLKKKLSGARLSTTEDREVEETVAADAGFRIHWDFAEDDYVPSQREQARRAFLENEKRFLTEVVERVVAQGPVDEAGVKKVEVAVEALTKSSEMRHYVYRISAGENTYILKYCRTRSEADRGCLINQWEIMNGIHEEGIVDGVSAPVIRGQAVNHNVEELPIEYFVMSYLPGKDLFDDHAENGDWEPLRAVEFILKSARLIRESVHSEGVVIRELKPSNMMLMEGDEPGLFDFDVSMQSDYDWQTDPLNLRVTGWHEFVEDGDMAVKTAERRKRPDLYSDVYSLAQVMNYLLNGKAVSGPRDLIRQKNQDIARLLKLALDRESRNYRMMDFILDLEELREGLSGARLANDQKEKAVQEEAKVSRRTFGKLLGSAVVSLLMISPILTIILGGISLFLATRPVKVLYEDVEIEKITEFDERFSKIASRFEFSSLLWGDEEFKQEYREKLLSDILEVSPELHELTVEFLNEDDFVRRNAVLNEMNRRFFIRNGGFLIYKRNVFGSAVLDRLAYCDNTENEVTVMRIDGRDIFFIAGIAEFSPIESMPLGLAPERTAISFIEVSQLRNRIYRMAEGDFVPGWFERLYDAIDRQTGEYAYAGGLLIPRTRRNIQKFYVKEFGGSSESEIARKEILVSLAHETTHPFDEVFGLAAQNKRMRREETSAFLNEIASGAEPHASLARAFLYYLNVDTPAEYRANARDSIILIYEEAVRRGLADFQLNRRIADWAQLNPRKKLALLNDVLDRLYPLEGSVLQGLAGDAYEKIYGFRPMAEVVDLEELWPEEAWEPDRMWLKIRPGDGARLGLSQIGETWMDFIDNVSAQEAKADVWWRKARSWIAASAKERRPSQPEYTIRIDLSANALREHPTAKDLKEGTSPVVGFYLEALRISRSSVGTLSSVGGNPYISPASETFNLFLPVSLESDREVMIHMLPELLWKYLDLIHLSYGESRWSAEEIEGKNGGRVLVLKHETAEADAGARLSDRQRANAARSFFGLGYDYRDHQRRLENSIRLSTGIEEIVTLGSSDKPPLPAKTTKQLYRMTLPVQASLSFLSKPARSETIRTLETLSNVAAAHLIQCVSRLSFRKPGMTDQNVVAIHIRALVMKAFRVDNGFDARLPIYFAWEYDETDYRLHLRVFGFAAEDAQSVYRTSVVNRVWKSVRSYFYQTHVPRYQIAQDAEDMGTSRHFFTEGTSGEVIGSQSRQWIRHPFQHDEVMTKLAEASLRFFRSPVVERIVDVTRPLNPGKILAVANVVYAAKNGYSDIRDYADEPLDLNAQILQPQQRVSFEDIELDQSSQDPSHESLKKDYQAIRNFHDWSFRVGNRLITDCEKGRIDDTLLRIYRDDLVRLQSWLVAPLQSGSPIDYILSQIRNMARIRSFDTTWPELQEYFSSLIDDMSHMIERIEDVIPQSDVDEGNQPDFDGARLALNRRDFLSSVALIAATGLTGASAGDEAGSAFNKELMRQVRREKSGDIGRVMGRIIAENDITGIGGGHFSSKPQKHLIDGLRAYLEANPGAKVSVGLEVQTSFRRDESREISDYLAGKTKDNPLALSLPGAFEIIEMLKGFSQDEAAGYDLRVFVFDNREINPFRGFSQDRGMEKLIAEEIERYPAHKFILFGGGNHMIKTDRLIASQDSPMFMRLLERRYPSQKKVTSVHVYDVERDFATRSGYLRIPANGFSRQTMEDSQIGAESFILRTAGIPALKDAPAWNEEYLKARDANSHFYQPYATAPSIAEAFDWVIWSPTKAEAESQDKEDGGRLAEPEPESSRPRASLIFDPKSAILPSGARAAKAELMIDFSQIPDWWKGVFGCATDTEQRRMMLGFFLNLLDQDFELLGDRTPNLVNESDWVLTKSTWPSSVKVVGEYLIEHLRLPEMTLKPKKDGIHLKWYAALLGGILEEGGHAPEAEVILRWIANALPGADQLSDKIRLRQPGITSAVQDYLFLNHWKQTWLAKGEAMNSSGMKFAEAAQSPHVALMHAALMRIDEWAQQAGGRKEDSLRNFVESFRGQTTAIAAAESPYPAMYGDGADRTVAVCVSDPDENRIVFSQSYLASRSAASEEDVLEIATHILHEWERTYKHRRIEEEQIPDQRARQMLSEHANGFLSTNRYGLMTPDALRRRLAAVWHDAAAAEVALLVPGIAQHYRAASTMTAELQASHPLTFDQGKNVPETEVPYVREKLNRIYRELHTVAVLMILSGDFAGGEVFFAEADKFIRLIQKTDSGHLPASVLMKLLYEALYLHHKERFYGYLLVALSGESFPTSTSLSRSETSSQIRFLRALFEMQADSLEGRIQRWIGSVRRTEEAAPLREAMAGVAKRATEKIASYSANLSRNARILMQNPDRVALMRNLLGEDLHGISLNAGHPFQGNTKRWMGALQQELMQRSGGHIRLNRLSYATLMRMVASHERLLTPGDLADMDFAAFADALASGDGFEIQWKRIDYGEDGDLVLIGEVPGSSLRDLQVRLRDAGCDAKWAIAAEGEVSRVFVKLGAFSIHDLAAMTEEEAHAVAGWVEAHHAIKEQSHRVEKVNIVHYRSRDLQSGFGAHIALPLGASERIEGAELRRQIEKRILNYQRLSSMLEQMWGGMLIDVDELKGKGDLLSGALIHQIIDLLNAGMAVGLVSALPLETTLELDLSRNTLTNTIVRILVAAQENYHADDFPRIAYNLTAFSTHPDTPLGFNVGQLIAKRMTFEVNEQNIPDDYAKMTRGDQVLVVGNIGQGYEGGITLSDANADPRQIFSEVTYSKRTGEFAFLMLFGAEERFRFMRAPIKPYLDARGEGAGDAARLARPAEDMFYFEEHRRRLREQREIPALKRQIMELALEDEIPWGVEEVDEIYERIEAGAIPLTGQEVDVLRLKVFGENAVIEEKITQLDGGIATHFGLLHKAVDVLVVFPDGSVPLQVMAREGVSGFELSGPSGSVSAGSKHEDWAVEEIRQKLGLGDKWWIDKSRLVRLGGREFVKSSNKGERKRAYLYFATDEDQERFAEIEGRRGEWLKGSVPSEAKINLRVALSKMVKAFHTNQAIPLPDEYKDVVGSQLKLAENYFLSQDPDLLEEILSSKMIAPQYAIEREGEPLPEDLLAAGEMVRKLALELANSHGDGRTAIRMVGGSHGHIFVVDPDDQNSFHFQELKVTRATRELYIRLLMAKSDFDALVGRPVMFGYVHSPDVVDLSNLSPAGEVLAALLAAINFKTDEDLNSNTHRDLKSAKTLWNYLNGLDFVVTAEESLHERLHLADSAARLAAPESIADIEVELRALAGYEQIPWQPDEVASIIEDIRNGVIPLKGEKLAVLEIGIDTLGNETERVIGRLDRRIITHFGLPHRVVDILVVFPDGTVPVHLRAHNKNPALAVAGPSGYVPADLEPEDGAAEEMRQELGWSAEWKIDKSRLVQIGKKVRVKSPVEAERKRTYVYFADADELAEFEEAQRQLEEVKEGKTEPEFRQWLEDRQAEGKGLGEVWAHHRVPWAEVVRALRGETALSLPDKYDAEIGVKREISEYYFLSANPDLLDELLNLNLELDGEPLHERLRLPGAAARLAGSFPAPVRYTRHPVQFNDDHFSFLERYIEQWEWMRSNFLPEIVERARETDSRIIHIMVLGSSTGEEIARSFHETIRGLSDLGEDPGKWTIRIHGIERSAEVAHEARLRLRGESPFVTKAAESAYAQEVILTLEHYADTVDESLIVHELDIGDEAILDLPYPDIIVANRVLYLVPEETTKWLFENAVGNKWKNARLALTSLQGQGEGGQSHDFTTEKLLMSGSSVYKMPYYFGTPKRKDAARLADSQILRVTVGNVAELLLRERDSERLYYLETDALANQVFASRLAMREALEVVFGVPSILPVPEVLAAELAADWEKEFDIDRDALFDFLSRIRSNVEAARADGAPRGLSVSVSLIDLESDADAILQALRFLMHEDISIPVYLNFDGDEALRTRFREAGFERYMGAAKQGTAYLRLDSLANLKALSSGGSEALPGGYQVAAQPKRRWSDGRLPSRALEITVAASRLATGNEMPLFLRRQGVHQGNMNYWKASFDGVVAGENGEDYLAQGARFASLMRVAIETALRIARNIKNFVETSM